MKRLLVFGVPILAAVLLLGCSPHQRGPYSVMVDYDCSLEETINAGCYDYIDVSIYEKYSWKETINGHGQQEVQFYLINIKGPKDVEELISELDKRNLRPATVKELVFFGNKYDETDSIVALGSVRACPPYRDVACLCCYDSKRELRSLLSSVDEARWWSCFYSWFLAVPK